jgi:RNA polymerase sigma-70 factor (ECF subfamily)
MGAAPDRAEELFTEHSRRIYAYCLRQLGSPEEAEDALQATYLNACRSLLSGFEPEVAQAWLFKVAQNVCLTRQRSSWRRRRVERPEDIQEIQDYIAAPSAPGDELFGIDDALASLPEQQRRAILLREWKGLSYREVAAQMGLSQGAVETLIFRARRSLATALDEPETPERRTGLMHGLQGAALVASFKSVLSGSMSTGLATGLALAASVTAIATSPIGHADAVRPKVERPARVEHVGPAAAPTLRTASADHDLASVLRDAASSGRGHAKGKGHGPGKPGFAGAKSSGNRSHGGGRPSWAGDESASHSPAASQGKSQGGGGSRSRG